MLCPMKPRFQERQLYTYFQHSVYVCIICDILLPLGTHAQGVTVVCLFACLFAISAQALLFYHYLYVE